MLKLTATAICLALALTGIAGCGNKSPEPKPLEQTSATDSAQPTSPPTLPPEVRQKNEAGVKATVEAFVEARNFAGRTGDTSAFDALFTRECNKCIGTSRIIQKTYNSGGYFRGADWVKKKMVFKGFENGVAFVELFVDTTPNSYKASGSSEVEKYDGSTNFIHFLQLTWGPDNQWRVSALDPEIS